MQSRVRVIHQACRHHTLLQFQRCVLCHEGDLCQRTFVIQACKWLIVAAKHLEQAYLLARPPFTFTYWNIPVAGTHAHAPSPVSEHMSVYIHRCTAYNLDAVPDLRVSAALRSSGCIAFRGATSISAAAG